ncbi:MAG: tRNA (adenosine(37)-N6)-threonylcarbamoyltransferase complex dimerization subunit type 1 TsaB, partial [Coriobacteriales bacterium]|nr:tRNA (adenosine(37)-N6)-threonylcarbamoyltransferase complex dimerization subunit type 1 TsaB [Coriobacteriales bacterium]
MPRDLVLAFDTASENIALAVARQGQDVGQGAVRALTLITSDDHPAARQANVQLMPSIDALFAAHALSVSDIACVVCGLGPGSFTGVRIGVATAKGIARGLGMPLYGVSTLDAVAWGAWCAGIRGGIGVVADAMRGEVYPARFDLDETGATRRDPHTVAKADEVAVHWRTAGEPLLLIGDGLKKFADAFAPSAPPAAPAAPDGTPPAAPATSDGTPPAASPAAQSARTVPPPPSLVSLTLGDEALWTPTGEGLLRAFEAACRAGQQGTGEAGTLLPLYTRLSDAEENERKRLATGGPIAQGAQVEVPLSGVADPTRLGQITYRPLAADDLDQVAALEAALFSPGAQTSGECWTRAMFADELARRDRSWWVVHEGNLLVGFAGGWVTDGVLQVLDVAVAPTHRCRGIAHDLLGRLMQDALDLGATQATLEVRESNTAACALYASLGFERLGTRPGYYPPTNGTVREAALIMAAPLRNGTGGGSSGTGGRSPAPFPQEPPPASPAFPTPPSPRILAIETSCDETAAAVIDGEGRLLSDTVASQVAFHSRFGGVVPEIASRKHTEAIVGVVDAALEEAGLTGWHELDALAVT